MNLDWMDRTVKCLWQGKNINVEETVLQTNHVVETIVSNMETMKKRGIEFPIEYVTSALKHFQEALETKDSYRLADCIKYEIKEIAIVYNEIMAE